MPVWENALVHPRVAIDTGEMVEQSLLQPRMINKSSESRESYLLVALTDDDFAAGDLGASKIKRKWIAILLWRIEKPCHACKAHCDWLYRFSIMSFSTK